MLWWILILPKHVAMNINTAETCNAYQYCRKFQLWSDSLFSHSVSLICHLLIVTLMHSSYRTLSPLVWSSRLLHAMNTCRHLQATACNEHLQTPPGYCMQWTPADTSRLLHAMNTCRRLTCPGYCMQWTPADIWLVQATACNEHLQTPPVYCMQLTPSEPSRLLPS
jgi:hypothetical protein